MYLIYFTYGMLSKLCYLWEDLLILIEGTVVNGISSSKSTTYELQYMFTVDCGPPGNPQRGSTNYTSTTEGSVAFYSCDQYLVPEGRMRANCTRNGWSPINPGHLSCTEGRLQ